MPGARRRIAAATARAWAALGAARPIERTTANEPRRALADPTAAVVWLLQPLAEKRSRREIPERSHCYRHQAASGAASRPTWNRTLRRGIRCPQLSLAH